MSSQSTLAAWLVTRLLPWPQLTTSTPLKSGAFKSLLNVSCGKESKQLLNNSDFLDKYVLCIVIII